MARVVGVGTDLTQISRFSRFLEQEKTAILDRLFTASEQTYARQKRNPAPHLAARFAAKEAFLKALGLGLREGISWQDMTVAHDALGKPSLQLSGRAREIFNQRSLTALHLSYSHDGDYAIATVVLEEA